jgi:hypothetical protein
MILIHVLIGNSNRATAEHFQHSGSSISDVVDEVVHAMMRCSSKLFRVKLLPDEWWDANPKFKHFRNCMGALDGTHIAAVVSSVHEKRLVNRKGFVSQNVLGVCNFDMTLSFLHLGWEGSAHDAKVLRDAIGKGMPKRRGKFYLGDAGYGLSRLVLTPYCGVRYHLKDWGNQQERPQNYKELFNFYGIRNCEL